MKAKALEMKPNMDNDRKKLVKIMSLVACGIFVVSLGTALIFHLDVNYGAGYSMPLNYGYVLLYLSLLILQFSFATLAVKARFCVLNDNLRFTF